MSSFNDFESRLAKHSKLYERLAILDAELGRLDNADGTEDQAVNSLRHLSREVLEDWAQHKESLVSDQARQKPTLRRDKKRCWHSSFGDICVWEQRYRVKGRGTRERPFCVCNGVKPRSYSYRPAYRQ